MDTIERLAAIEDIKRLKARYFRCMDMKDWAGLEAVFAPDLVADFPEISEQYVYQVTGIRQRHWADDGEKPDLTAEMIPEHVNLAIFCERMLAHV